MWMRQVWIRFYKSFNYDYELKAHPDAVERAWQMTADGWRPHVGIPLEPDITAVVGANESGKSHLLDAIAIVLTGIGLEKTDFCRYSSLFSVETGKRGYPEVGATFELTEYEIEILVDAGVALASNGNLLLFRRNPDVVEVLDGEGAHVRLNGVQANILQSLLPHVHKLDTQIDLPDSVSISALAGEPARMSDRAKRFELLKMLAQFKAPDQITEGALKLFSLIDSVDSELDEKQRLGRDLLTKVACIDQTSFSDLQRAIAEEREGLVNGLIQEMNKSIARHLNIARWWSQDADFELRVSPREHELVFTIRDRTGTDYSFSERSRGLTFFLSYYVQLLSHERPEGKPEVLLMDEPDAYLSAQGQQDLLRVLENYARPEDSERSDQVLYVTHSPFLINRNAGHRVRVVDKGSRDEGTRLVKNATQNHYEPLRTALGAAVAETAFIGGDNLFVEGISDQILLTGMNARVILSGAAPSKYLDLNQVTLVPGGSNMAYMLYLARGRDQYKPACAVLLDSDKAGRDAKKAIKRGGARGKPTVPENLIVMLGDWAKSVGVSVEEGVVVEEPEDLVPLSLAGIAARRYAQVLLGLSEDVTGGLKDSAIASRLTVDNHSMWNSVESAFLSEFDAEIGKVGFAKELLAYVRECDAAQELSADIAALDGNFALLLSALSETLRAAREREEDGRRDERVERCHRRLRSGPLERGDERFSVICAQANRCGGRRHSRRGHYSCRYSGNSTRLRFRSQTIG
ncbi:AAA family ATPase [Rhodococcus fascians]|nr:AAA family ATPase [Rhodococcus fascians]MBY4114535.1 AAA family ATPase [Rhodococcus fascians]